MHDLQIFVFPVYVLPFYVMRSSVGLTLSESPENQSLRPRNGKSWIFPHKILINRWVRTKIAGTNMNKGQLYKHNPSPFASAVRPACAVPRSHGRRARGGHETTCASRQEGGVCMGTAIDMSRIFIWRTLFGLILGYGCTGTPLADVALKV